MFSVAQHRYASLSKLAFVLLHSLALLLAAKYNSNTPDLYPNNAHHKLGWAVTWIAMAQLIFGQSSNAFALLARYITFRLDSGDRQRLMPLLPETFEEHGSDDDRLPNEYPMSRNSRQSFEICTLPTNVVAGPSPSSRDDDEEKDVGFDDNLVASACHLSRGAKAMRALNQSFHYMRKTFPILRTLISRSLLLLGYSALCTGVVTFGRFFVRHLNLQIPDSP